MALARAHAPLKTGLYQRISLDKTGRAAGVRRQEKENQELVERLGWEVVEVYVDNDTSAYSGRRRPEFDRMQADLRAGRIEAIVAWHPDRLYRRIRDLLGLIDLINETGAQIATVKAGDVDLATANGRLVAKIGASVAEHESEHKAERTEAWHRERAEKGLPNSGGRRPFGYAADKVTVVEEEAALIREAATRRLEGETHWSIVNDFIHRGIVTTTGKTFNAVTLGNVLCSPRVAGKREHNGTLHSAAWPAILDEQSWLALRAMRETMRTGRGRPATYPLTGVLFCGVCGTKMSGNPMTSGRKVYRCPTQQTSRPGCGKVARSADHLEGYLRDAAIAALVGDGEEPPLAAHLRSRGRTVEAPTELVVKLEGYQKRLSALEAEYVEGAIDLTTWKRMSASLQERIDGLNGQIAAKSEHGILAALPATPEGLRGWWEHADAERRRAVLSAVFEKVFVQPTVRGGKIFDPTRIDLVWREQKKTK